MLIPQKRGPKFSYRRTDISIENRVIELRKLILNRQTIAHILRNEGFLLGKCFLHLLFHRNQLNKLKSMENKEKPEKKSFIVSRDDKILFIGQFAFCKLNSTIKTAIRPII